MTDFLSSFLTVSWDTISTAFGLLLMPLQYVLPVGGHFSSQYFYYMQVASDAVWSMDFALPVTELMRFVPLIAALILARFAIRIYMVILHWIRGSSYQSSHHSI